jgi:tetratricopeptide (TPR) repeat protein
VLNKTNMKYKIFSLLLLSLFSLTSSFGQALDEETGFIYVKAEYLFETGRYEEAIVSYNQVISKDPKYKNALINRGHSKFQLGAYKGAKMDALQSIELVGITPEAAALLGRSSASMNEINAAINSLTAAITMDDMNFSFYELRASVYENDDQLLKACQDYEKAMNLGSAAAELKAKSLCGISKTNPSVPPSRNPSTQVINANTENTSDHSDPQNTSSGQIDNQSSNSTNSNATSSELNNANSEGNVGSTNTDSVTIDDSEPMVVNDGLPKEDNFVNTFVIDEDLTIDIYGQELGRRKIKEIPSILILADENGKVTVNICVNKAGVVTKAEFNASMSTIAKKSLVSLALRKAKEFEFTKGEYDLQCGIMIFKIKGS